MPLGWQHPLFPMSVPMEVGRDTDVVLKPNIQNTHGGTFLPLQVVRYVDAEKQSSILIYATYLELGRTFDAAAHTIPTCKLEKR